RTAIQNLVVAFWPVPGPVLILQGPTGLLQAFRQIIAVFDQFLDRIDANAQFLQVNSHFGSWSFNIAGESARWSDTITAGLGHGSGLFWCHPPFDTAMTVLQRGVRSIEEA